MSAALQQVGLTPKTFAFFSMNGQLALPSANALPGYLKTHNPEINACSFTLVTAPRCQITTATK
jgi:hypothetical protein